MRALDAAEFTAVRTVKSGTQRLLAPPDKVFPLLCPTREYEWIEHWRCRLVHSESGRAELDCVFATDFPYEGDETWVVNAYRPNEEIQFVRFNGQRTIRHAITLADNGDGTTTAHWRQVLTGLNEAGNHQVAELTDEAYHQKIADVERRLNHFLSTGQMLRDEPS